MKNILTRLSLLAILSIGTLFAFSCSEDPLPATPKSKVRVIHSASDAPAVNVNVDGATAITALNYRSASVYAEVNSGERLISVIAPTLNNAEVFSQRLTFLENSNYTVFAVGPVIAGKISPVLANDLNNSVAGKVKIRFAHMAPDVPTVDVKVGSASVAPLFANAGVKSVSAYKEVDPMSVSLVVTGAGGNTALLEFEPVVLTAGAVYTAVAMGTLDPTDAFPVSVRVYVDTDMGNTFVDLVAKSSTPPAQVMIVHASPDAPAVDINVNGSKVTSSPLTFPSSSGYLSINVSNGNPDIKIQVTNSTTIIPIPASALPTLVAGKKYTLFVNGLLGNGTLDFKVVEDNFVADSLKPIIRFAHMSPDAPAVDILLVIPNLGDYEVPTLQGKKFNEVTGFVQAQGGSFPVKVRLTGTQTIALTIPSFTFTNGKVITIFAHGLASGTPALGAGVIMHN